MTYILLKEQLLAGVNMFNKEYNLPKQRDNLEKSLSNQLRKKKAKKKIMIDCKMILILIFNIYININTI